MDGRLAPLCGSRRWQPSGALGETTLDNLRWLNHLYLERLATPALCCARQSTLGGAEGLAAELARLDGECRRALAQCPFALFDAQFTDATVWTGRVNAVRDTLVWHGAPGSDPSGFAQLALFYAWHLVRSDPLAARLLLGMSARIQEVFAALALPQVQSLARVHPVLPRWLDRPAVWQIFLGAVRLDPRELAHLHMFGIQLIAGDLARARNAG